MDNYTASAIFLSAVTNGLNFNMLKSDIDLINKCAGLDTDAINDLIVARYL